MAKSKAWATLVYLHPTSQHAYFTDIFMIMMIGAMIPYLLDEQHRTASYHVCCVYGLRVEPLLASSMVSGRQNLVIPKALAMGSP